MEINLFNTWKNALNEISIVQCPYEIEIDFKCIYFIFETTKYGLTMSHLGGETLAKCKYARDTCGKQIF